jgi:hypothetical protein
MFRISPLWAAKKGVQGRQIFAITSHTLEIYIYQFLTFAAKPLQPF